MSSAILKRVRQSWMLYLGGLVVLLGFLYVGPCYPYWTAEDRVITVAEKIVKRSPGSDSDLYLIVDTEGNSYKIEDNLAHWQWRSTDLYGKMQKDQMYQVKVYGFRWGWLSWYPNIYEVKITG